MSRLRAWVVVSAVAVVLAAAGCTQPIHLGGPPGAPQAEYGEFPYGQDCDDPMPAIEGPATEPVPSDAVLVKATRCIYETERVPGDGEWSVRVEQEATTGLDELATALRTPSEPRGQACALIGYPAIVITVSDTTGKQFHPTIPTTACGAALKVAADAIAALPWTTVNRTPAVRIHSELEITSGCSGLYKPMIDITAADGPRDDAPTAHLVTTPDEMRVCRYEVGAHPDHPGEPLGTLTSASTLGPDAIRDLFAAVNMAPAASGPCDPGSPFATVQPVDAAPWLTIELDGCFRVLLDADGTLRRLDPDLVTRLLA